MDVGGDRAVFPAQTGAVHGEVELGFDAREIAVDFGERFLAAIDAGERGWRIFSVASLDSRRAQETRPSSSRWSFSTCCRKSRRIEASPRAGRFSRATRSFMKTSRAC